MNTLYHVIAVAGVLAVIAGALLGVARLQAERPFSSLSALLAGATTAGSLAVYLLAIDLGLKQAWTMGLLCGGAAFGALVGSRIPLYDRQGVVLCRASGWHLAPPGLAIAAFQIEGLRGSPDGTITSLAAVYAATAFTVAASLVLLLRRGARRQAGVVAEEPVAATEPQVDASVCFACGAPLRPDARFCMSCGAPVETAVAR